MNRYRGVSTYVTAKQKIALWAIYLSLGTFKNIALGLIILMIGLAPINLGQLASASVIDLTPTTGLTEGNAILKNFTIHFSNRTNATLENYVTSQEKGNAIIQAINTILRGQDFEPLAEEEELEEEQEEESSSSSSSESSSGDSGPGLGGGPGDLDTFPEDMQPQPQPQPDQPNNGSEDNSNDNNNSNGDNTNEEAEDSTE